jgi:two-component system sensor histidine kinase KdpD
VPRIDPVVRVTISILAVALATLVCARLLEVNPTTAALTYLVVILLIASGWGIAESTAASLVAVLCLNFFFLPPVGTLTIADPQNWIALLAFLVTAAVTSQLSGRARQRNLEALARQRDLERLYALSRTLLLADRGALGAGDIVRHIADTFELPTAALYDKRADRITSAGSRDIPGIDARLRETARTGASWRDPSGVLVMAIQLGGAPIGSLALPDSGLSDTVLQSVANLAAIGLEQARAAEATARAEASRESSELRATVLDALAHEFKTPLTSMKAASSDLLASPTAGPRDRELIAIIDEDLERFQGLVTDAVRMLRIDAGDFAVHPTRHSLASIVTTTVEKYGARLDGHLFTQRIPADLDVVADRELLALALRQLLDNALKYSSSSSRIEIRAGGNGGVEIAVWNSDSTIPDAEQPRVFERFYRGSDTRQIPGTGMGLSIVQQIVGAHGGIVTVASAPGTGTTVTISLPRGGAPRV